MRFAPGVKPGAMPKPVANNPRAVNPRQAGVKGTTGGPKPAPTGMTGQLVGMNPNANALIAAAKPTYTGPGFGPSAPFNKAKMDQIKSSLYGKPTMKKGGKVSSASKRADGIATKGKTKGKMV